MEKKLIYYNRFADISKTIEKDNNGFVKYE